MSMVATLKRSVSAFVGRMELEDIRLLRGEEDRLAWLKKRYGGWSQGLMHHLQASMARRARKLARRDMADVLTRMAP